MVLMNIKGEVIDRHRLSNVEMTGYLEKCVPQGIYTVLEATRNWPFMYDMLTVHVDRVELAHPNRLNQSQMQQ